MQSRMSTHRGFAATAVTAVVALTLFGCSDPQADAPAASAPTATSACQLTVGWDPWEPYSYETVDARVAGLDVEIFRAVAATAGCAVEFRKGNWVALLGELATGDVDVLMAATQTEERRVFADFSEPYRDESFALFVRSDDESAEQAGDVAALLAAGARIGITDGYYYGEAVEAALAGATDDGQVVAAAVPELNYRHLQEGTVDAVLGDPFVASAVLRRSGQRDAVMQLGEPVYSGAVRFMYSSAGVSDAQLVRLAEALAALSQRGDIQRVLDRYRG